MRVLVHEQWHLGHSFYYLSHILPRLADLVDEVVVAITPLGRDSVEFRDILAPLSDRVDFDTNLPVVVGMAMKHRVEAYRYLRETVRRVRPDYVIVPSGDMQTAMMGLYSVAGRGGLPGGLPGEAGMHFGYGPAATSAGNRAKETFYRVTQRLSSWKKIHYVNALVYEDVRKQGGALARRAELLPHPVEPGPRLDKGTSRRRLGIPEDGRYIGLFALLDRRKAIDRFLAAFCAAAPRPDDRLLLAGRLDPVFAQLIDREYADLVRQGRLILMNQYIEDEKVDAVLSALDVVCTPYPHFGILSSALLQGVAAGRPVLANDFGWSRAVVRRFGFGWTCDVLDPEAFAATLIKALEESGDYRENEATRRLVSFHAPENFAERWLTGIRDTLGRPLEGDLPSWDWVLQALDEDRRALL